MAMGSNSGNWAHLDSVVFVFSRKPKRCYKNPHMLQKPQHVTKTQKKYATKTHICHQNPNMLQKPMGFCNIFHFGFL
jgi:hypothetical protein